MSSVLIAFSVLVFWLGPPLAVLAAALLMFVAKRDQVSGGRMAWHDFWSPILVWGVAGAAIWIGLVALLLLITRAGNAGLWIVFIPWAFAAGEVVGFVKLRRRLYADQSPSS